LSADRRRAVRAAAAAIAVGLAVLAAPASAAADPNGCGPTGLGPLVPDRPLGFDFTVACIAHDDCYAVPWPALAATRPAARLVCDNAFLADLVRGCPADQRCLDLAHHYHRAVRWLGGAAYALAQRRVAP
jgi:hypothetical protein